MTLGVIRNLIRQQWGKTNSLRKFWARLYRMMGRNHFVLKGEDNLLDLTDSLLLNVSVDLVGDENAIIFREGCRISNTTIRVRGHHHKIEIGRNCSFQAGEIWVEDDTCTLLIGENTTLVQAHFAVTEPGSIVEIGPDCMFAHGIEVRNGDSHSILDVESGSRINFAEDIHIGAHVWIATDVLIMKGVKLGENSVVAARSVVTHSFPANSLIAGIPAKAIKHGITWDRKRILKPQEQA